MNTLQPYYHNLLSQAVLSKLSVYVEPMKVTVITWPNPYISHQTWHPGFCKKVRLQPSMNSPNILNLIPTSLLTEGRNFKIQLRDPCGGRVCFHHFSVHVLGRKKNVQSREVSSTASQEIPDPSPAVSSSLHCRGSRILLQNSTPVNL